MVTKFVWKYRTEFENYFSSRVPYDVEEWGDYHPYKAVSCQHGTFMSAWEHHMEVVCSRRSCDVAMADCPPALCYRLASMFLVEQRLKVAISILCPTMS
jgi:hypothetical protein